MTNEARARMFYEASNRVQDVADAVYWSLRRMGVDIKPANEYTNRMYDNTAAQWWDAWRKYDPLTVLAFEEEEDEL